MQTSLFKFFKMDAPFFTVGLLGRMLISSNDMGEATGAGRRCKAVTELELVEGTEYV